MLLSYKGKVLYQCDRCKKDISPKSPMLVDKKNHYCSVECHKPTESSKTP